MVYHQLSISKKLENITQYFHSLIFLLLLTLCNGYLKRRLNEKIFSFNKKILHCRRFDFSELSSKGGQEKQKIFFSFLKKIWARDIKKM
ncbi:MAG: hypothetical protein COU40_01780 [Candidatus Moranbacteria bacterium CG10_big_fil_rev_8_21_14_0_10_35_21]|nr:MAG: hypothetical protein COU40_01780 [Candidatus Moranbacteria bacterium CG10_big_fil_rev_8_21_14_0_10_35_21]PJA88968.1 MAG: hypothetical protein CO139_00290 [Candidatus Moranbacteria bacterium CG_4_9_14_3_um_filter_36_9]